MTPKPRARQLADEAKFVFQGSVKKVKASTLKGVPKSDRTVVVRIDRVIQAPEALSDHAGRDVTVLLAPGEKVDPGQTLIFYTNGWIFGEGIAVQSIGHEVHLVVSPLPGATVDDEMIERAAAEYPNLSVVLRDGSLLFQSTRPEVRSLLHFLTDFPDTVHLKSEISDLKSLAESCSRQLRAWADVEDLCDAGGTIGGGGPGTSERISEHAPLWQEAVIAVDEVHKGGRARKQVVVRFPSSSDVRWYQAPKFHAGQEGVFLLHKQQAGGARAKAMGAPLKGEQYTALHPEDFQPLDQLPQIRLAAGARAPRRASPSVPLRRARRRRPR